MTMLKSVFLGSVNRWECDENDHLNVMFFARKMYQTLEAGIKDMALMDAVALASLAGKITSNHMRFIAEARLAAPITGNFCLLTVEPNYFEVLTELRHTATNKVMAAFIYRIAHKLEHRNFKVSACPDYAGYRGIKPRDLPFATWSHNDALDHGFKTIGRGTIQADEVTKQGKLLPFLYMGKSSDAMPNLWAKFEGESASATTEEANLGGAVLEYQMNFYDKLNLGDRYEVISGIEQLANKTQHLLHLFFNIETGKCILGCEAVSISMDLNTRKSIAIPQQKRALLEKLLVSIH